MHSVGFFIIGLLTARALQLTTVQESQGSRRNQYHKQAMKNFEDVSYVATMKIGTQELDAVLDTGSFDVEVVSTRCGKSCRGAGSDLYYNRDSSHTYKEGDLIQLTSYESGDVLAQSGTESVGFGPLQIRNQQFWEVVYAELDILTYGDFQAIVGVGPPGVDIMEIREEAEAADYMSKEFQKLGFEIPKNFSKELYEREVPKMKTVLEMLETNTFSVCLGRKYGSEGYFVWNDHKPTDNPAFRELDVAGKSTWGVKLSDVIMKEKITGKDFELSCGGKTSCAAIIDSGTSLLMVPTKVYNDIFKHLKSLDASCDDMDRLPPIVFKLADKELQLPPSMYMGLVDENSLDRPTSRFFPFFSNTTLSLTQRRGEKSCELLIGKIDVETQLGPMWILGMPFFREYYTTFELGDNLRDRNGRRLHVAKATSDCEPQHGTELELEQNIHLPMSVSPSRIRVPKWVVKAHRKGFIDI